MNITLYSTGCPQCNVLKAKLDEKGIKYDTVTDEQVMLDKGFMSAPLLDVDGSIMTFKDAVDWVRGIDE